MAIAYINKTIPIHNITAQRCKSEPIGDFTRTAGGCLRSDVIAIKRTWQIEARYLTKEEYDAIIDHLDSVYYTFTWFWLDEFGGTAATNSIMARIEIEDDRRPFGRGGVWYMSGRHLSLTVTEQ